MIFKKSLTLAASAQEVFDFHLRPENLPKITPPWVRVKLHECPSPVRDGGVVSLTAYQFGIVPQEMRVVVSPVTPPTEEHPGVIVDRVETDGFDRFVHTRTIEPLSLDRCTLTDELDIRLKGYPFTLPIEAVVWSGIAAMFHYRHGAMKTVYARFCHQKSA